MLGYCIGFYYIFSLGLFLIILFYVGLSYFILPCFTRFYFVLLFYYFIILVDLIFF